MRLPFLPTFPRLYLLVSLVLACGRDVKPTEPPVNVEVHLQVVASYADNSGQLRGISDLARDNEGRLWMIPERQMLLARVDKVLADGKLTYKTFDLKGKPEDCDGESLTWIAKDRFAIGSEKHVKNRESDAIFLGKIDEGNAKIDDQIDMPYSLWAIKADDNRGLEGLCFAHGQLYAVSETVIEKNGQRWAPVGRYDLQTKAWTPLRILLTSTVGRISALSCRELPNKATELWAIERYYGIVRWLRLPLEATSSGDVVPMVHADLAVSVTPALANVPNFEGLTDDPSAATAVWLLNDNSSGDVVDGPNYLIHLTPIP